MSMSMSKPMIMLPLLLFLFDNDESFDNDDSFRSNDSFVVVLLFFQSFNNNDLLSGGANTERGTSIDTTFVDADFDADADTDADSNDNDVHEKWYVDLCFY